MELWKIEAVLRWICAASSKTYSQSCYGGLRHEIRVGKAVSGLLPTTMWCGRIAIAVSTSIRSSRKSPSIGMARAATCYHHVIAINEA